VRATLPGVSAGAHPDRCRRAEPQPGCLARELLLRPGQRDGSRRGQVKKVEAILNEGKLEAVRTLLNRVGGSGMTVTEVRGYGHQKGTTERYRGQEHKRVLLTKVKVEMVVEDGRVNALVEELVRATRTGRIGDGKIFVTPVDEAVRIRTLERGKEAI